MRSLAYFYRTTEGRTFSRIWLGQLVSSVGTNLTRFGLAIWVFIETGSTMQLSLVVLAGAVPALLLSPFAGALVDRWDRRNAMIVADGGAAVGTAVIALLVGLGGLEMWHLYGALAFSSAFGAFQFPAYSAVATLLVPKEHYTRTAALVGLAGSVGLLIGPALAGALLVSAGLGTLFVIDLVTFFFAVAMLLGSRVPRPSRSVGGLARPGTLLREAKEGLSFITNRRGLLTLLLIFSIVNVAFAFTEVLLIPLVLSLANETVVGLVVSSSAFGLLVGSAVMGSWGGSKNRIRDLFLGLAGIAIGLTAVGLRPSLPAVLIAITFAHLAVPLAFSSNQAIWQSKVPADIQGRVFAIRQVFEISATPAALLAAGFLAEFVFEPFVDSSSIANGIVGTGPGRGTALLLSTMGLIALISTLLTWRSPSIQSLETDVPDAEQPTTRP
jgi:DHA3 family macrolide efflux protein-like MFS transporter